MSFTDEELLTFTDTAELEYADKLHEADADEARELLAEHGDTFRQHLVVAKLLEEQADHLERADADKTYGKVELRGYKSGLRHSIADLRRGDFLPGGGRFD
jgi:hypothetical protein